MFSKTIAFHPTVILIESHLIMDDPLGVEQKYSLITRRLELQNGWCGKKLQSLVTEGKTIKYQWGEETVIAKHCALPLTV